ncbi:sodium pump decarboxylase subunit gamma [Methylophaga sp. 42_25_T18]|nr:sodium pump decarboxylase subunit gamma [Methylophaga sp. 42_25_T18]
MESSDLLNEGFTLMLFGVGFVFVFLTLLVIATSLMSWIIIRYEKSVGVLPEEGIPAPTAVLSPHKHAHNTHTQDKSLITVLSAAVHKYRSRNKK